MSTSIVLPTTDDPDGVTPSHHSPLAPSSWDVGNVVVFQGYRGRVLLELESISDIQVCVNVYCLLCLPRKLCICTTQKFYNSNSLHHIRHPLVRTTTISVPVKEVAHVSVNSSRHFDSKGRVLDAHVGPRRQGALHARLPFFFFVKKGGFGEVSDPRLLRGRVLRTVEHTCTTPNRPPPVLVSTKNGPLY